LKQLHMRLTYANVMSSLAVFLVLGGATAFAAGHLGKNTVGTKQLKKNAVTSAKVKNGSLNAADFKAGQLPSGPQGPKGDKGDTGTQGPKGDTGASATKLWAVVSSTGSLVHSSGATNSEKLLLNGTYEVDFNQDVSGCVFEATPSLGFSLIYAEPRTAKPDGVYVGTANTSGTLTNHAFNLAVFC